MQSRQWAKFVAITYPQTHTFDSLSQLPLVLVQIFEQFTEAAPSPSSVGPAAIDLLGHHHPIIRRLRQWHFVKVVCVCWDFFLPTFLSASAKEFQTSGLSAVAFTLLPLSSEIGYGKSWHRKPTTAATARSWLLEIALERNNRMPGDDVGKFFALLRSQAHC